MGYYTDYTLTIPIGAVGEKTKHKQAALEAATVVAKAGLTKYGAFKFETSDPMKWYDHEYEIACLSRRHPAVIFLLEGKGEDADDRWLKMFQDGKMKQVKAVMTWPSFNTVEWQTIGADEDE